MYSDAFVFCTTRHWSLKIDPGVKYRIDGPIISARASEKYVYLKIVLYFCFSFKTIFRSIIFDEDNNTGTES